MFALVASSPPLALALPILLTVALAIGLTGGPGNGRSLIRRAMFRVIGPFARLATRLDGALAAVLVAATVDANTAPPVAVEVLVEDRALRERARRRTRIVLARCVATMGAPPTNCAVLIARELERDGRPVSWCVERLACADGTIRTIISLSLGGGPGAPALDALAARLAGCYPIASGAERTVLIADAPPTLPPPAVAAIARMVPPDTVGIVSIPVGADTKRA